MCMASCGPHVLPVPSPWYLLCPVVQTLQIARLWGYCWHLLPISEVRPWDSLVREGLTNVPDAADPAFGF